MEMLEIKMILFFSKEILKFKENDDIDYEYIYNLGLNKFKEILNYLVDNNEINETQKNRIKKFELIFNFKRDEVNYVQEILDDIQKGKECWRNGNVDYIKLLKKLYDLELINKEEKIRYLAHYNYYDEVIELLEEENNYFNLAKKYGSVNTRLNFHKYEIMKNLEKKLKLKNKLDSKVKI